MKRRVSMALTTLATALIVSFALAAFTTDSVASDVGTLDKASAERAHPATRPYSPYAGRNFPTHPFFFRVVRADHLAVIALSVGRPKDFTRILALLESGSVSREEIASLAQRHGLADAWTRFGARFLDG